MKGRLRPSVLNTLLAQLVVGELDPKGLETLQEAMRSDRETFKYCFEVILTAGALDQVSREGAEVEIAAGEPDETVVPIHSIRRRRLLKWSAVAAVLLLVLGLTFSFLRRYNPGYSGPVVATLVQGGDIKWAQDGYPTKAGGRLGEGPMELLEGAVQIRLRSGVDVLLRAPCRFDLTPGNGMTLHRGMLTANVPHEALGFTVRTDHARVVDRGTRFGMIVDALGHLETHVFAGLVSVYSDALVTQEEGNLTEGAALILDTKGKIVSRTTADETYFLTALDEGFGGVSPGRVLSLADIVGGGNGYGTGRLNQGIDPVSGTILLEPLFRKHSDRRHQFIPLEDWRYIDGVFIPNGEHRPMFISSTGLRFDRCPYTNSRYYDGIFNGARLSHQNERHQGRLNGTTYGTRRRPAINMHPNVGITFDLEAICRDHPGLVLAGLRAECGLSQTTPSLRKREVEFWILLDGKVQEHFLCPPRGNSAAKLSLTIPEATRFLTLATTCPEHIDYCWAFFGDPVLEFRRTGE